MASQKFREKLSDLHDYEDKQTDQPFLLPENQE